MSMESIGKFEEVFQYELFQFHSYDAIKNS